MAADPSKLIGEGADSSDFRVFSLKFFMTATTLFVIEATILFVFIFGLFIVLRQIFFFGFAPLFPSRQKKVEMILKNVKINNGQTIYSLGYGRSGFLRVIEKRYPRVKLVGVKNNHWHCLIARLQVFLRRSRIKIRYSDYYRADISDANIVYCFLDVPILRDIYKKLRVESRSGAVIISSGFIIPYLKHPKILKTEISKHWFDFIVGKHEKVLTEKQKEHKPDQNVYIYEV